LALPETPASFHQDVAALFRDHFSRISRYLQRLSGDPELAADITQDTFVRLQRRGALPDAPGAWLISVALNLFRNEASTRTRRRRLLELRPVSNALEGFPGAEGEIKSHEARRRVRRALDRLPERDRHLLLLQAEGYTYREIATALRLNEASIGVLLARARRSFRGLYGGSTDAP